MTNTEKNKCCIKPKYPYTFTEQACDYCCIGCDKPGIGSPKHDPGDNRCSDCALCCIPCTLVFDVICCIPMTFGCYELEKP